MAACASQPKTLVGDEILLVEVLAPSGDPIGRIEVDLWKGDAAKGPPDAGHTVADERGIAVFNLPEGEYKIGFNLDNFPSNLVYPEKIPVSVKKGETKKTITLSVKKEEKEEQKLGTENAGKNTESAVLSIPDFIENNCIGFVIGAPDEIRLISKIGGAWARPHPGPFSWGFIETSKGNFDFSMADDYVSAAQQDKVAILGTIWPFADWDQKQCRSNCEVTEEDMFYPTEKVGQKNGIPKSRCAPCNYGDYQNFILKLVERYDGDGVDDMPNLRIPIKYWEVLNEPEMKNNDMTFFKGSKDDYIAIFSKTKEAIKQACSGCKVLHGGMAGVEQFMADYWGDILNKIDYDVANIHYIKNRDLSSLNVRDFKKLVKPGIPIWVTEAQYESNSEIVPSVEGALNAGASKIFFTQFRVGEFGLVNDYSEGYNNIAAKCR